MIQLYVDYRLSASKQAYTPVEKLLMEKNPLFTEQTWIYLELINKKICEKYNLVKIRLSPYGNAA